MQRRHALQAGVAFGVLGNSVLANTQAETEFSHKPLGGPNRQRFPHSLALGLPLRFPADAGAHPDYQTEWWYITGYANVDGVDAAYGFQITFFRSRVPQTQNLQSRLAAKQLLFAHAALTDVRGNTLWHDQRIARWSGAPPGTNPLDTASASTQDTGVVLRDWSLLRAGADLVATVRASDFALDLRFVQSQPVLLQGEQGLSRKGPEAEQTSYYYSLPHLQAQGDITLQGKRQALAAQSTAWLDHEWSQAMMHTDAVGWDWIGINLFDGSALTAFQMRDKAGRPLWGGGSYRSGAADTAALHTFARGDVLFTPQRHWRSPLSQANYPVQWAVRVHHRSTSGALDASYTVKAVVDKQELDSRQSTGAVYWEGLCEVWDANGLVGRGYLEMTGYAAPIKF